MTTAIELIKLLYNEGFFSTWKTIQEVKDALTKKGFNFSEQLILVSLKNATTKEVLSRKTENKRIKFSQREPPQMKIKEKEISELNTILSKITEKKLGEK